MLDVRVCRMDVMRASGIVGELRAQVGNGCFGRKSISESSEIN